MRSKRFTSFVGRLLISHLLVAGIAFQSGVVVSSAACSKLQQETISSSSTSTSFQATIVSKSNTDHPTETNDLNKDDIIPSLEGSSPLSSIELQPQSQQRSDTITNNIRPSAMPTTPRVKLNTPLQKTSSLQFQPDNFDMHNSSSKSFVHGVAWTKQASFQKFYDLGYPLERIPAGSPLIDNDDPLFQNVLLLYLDPSAQPRDYKAKKYDLFQTIPNAQLATENCQELQVVIVKPSTSKEEKDTGRHQKCIAIMPHWGPSAHVHRFSRPLETTTEKKKEDVKKSNDAVGATNTKNSANTHVQGFGTNSTKMPKVPPMEYVSHIHRKVYKDEVEPASREAYHWNKVFSPKLVEEAWNNFANYVQHYKTALEELTPILHQAASSSAAQSSFGSDSKESKGVIIVMVTNVARIQFLINFVCAAKAIDMDLSNVIVFCLDSASYQVAVQVLELQAYYHPDLFGKIHSSGKAETGIFGDMRFSRIMITKVYSVQLVNALGYDVLFMDTDVIPLQPKIVDYFADRWLLSSEGEDDDENNNKKDIYLQHDTNARLEQAPFSANSGFYFVKHNWKTQYFFQTLVRMEDLILRVQSHQQVMNYLMSQFQSLVGLQVKVLGGYGEENKLFPNGSFRNNKDFIDGMKEGKERPYIFHANWNSSGKEKKSQLQQINLWFINNDDDEQCSVSIGQDVGGTPSSSSSFTIPSTLTKEIAVL